MTIVKRTDYKKIGELEAFLCGEVAVRGKLTKRFKLRANAASISDSIFVTVITALEVGSVTTLATGVGFPIRISLAATGLLLGLSSIGARNAQKVLKMKIKKHDKITTLAESKLDSISGLVSKAIEDANVPHKEYQFILYQ